MMLRKNTGPYYYYPIATLYDSPSEVKRSSNIKRVSALEIDR